MPFSRSRYSKENLDELIRRNAPSGPTSIGSAREAYWRLVGGIRVSSKLLHSQTNLQSQKNILRAGRRIASLHNQWRRSPEFWKPRAVSPFDQFRSLVCHLLAKYPLPKFMADIWLNIHLQDWEQQLFFHLANGRSVRKFTLPFSYQCTKAAAKYFLHAPDDCLPLDAFLWARVRALGGDARLARLFISPPICAYTLEDRAFWESVIRFMILHAPISEQEIIAIVAFLYQQRFQSAERVWGYGVGDQPLQPDFSLEGRTLQSLRRHITHWRTDLIAKRPELLQTSRKPTWSPSVIQPYREQRGDCIWTIEELLTDRELRVEGGIMQHCAATYIAECARRETTLWSMKVQQGEQRKRVLTIEVLPHSKRIWQAKGKANAEPSHEARKILNRWSEQEGLKQE